ncbi:hypothetical protein B0H14DRAFT_2581420 [Mycena olivaceomarginata]|nr:hypothetical protein B0H14DRAFT_2581420 [Mycena olivaceomarginata]
MNMEVVTESEVQPGTGIKLLLGFDSKHEATQGGLTPVDDAENTEHHGDDEPHPSITRAPPTRTVPRQRVAITFEQPRRQMRVVVGDGVEGWNNDRQTGKSHIHAKLSDDNGKSLDRVGLENYTRMQSCKLSMVHGGDAAPLLAEGLAEGLEGEEEISRSGCGGRPDSGAMLQRGEENDLAPMTGRSEEAAKPPLGGAPGGGWGGPGGGGMPGARNSQRRSAREQKARETAQAADEAADLKAKIAALKEAQRDPAAQAKELSHLLKALKGTSGSRLSKGNAPAILTASSSGRVKTATRRPDPPARNLAPQPENLPTDGAAYSTLVPPGPGFVQTSTDLAETFVMQSDGVIPFNPHAQPAQSADESAFTQLLNETGVNLWAANDDYLAALITQPYGGTFADVPTPDLLAWFDSMQFSNFDSDFTALMPTSFPADHSAQSNFAGPGPTASASSDLISPEGPFIRSHESSPWPTVPPARPDSPLDTALSVEEPSISSSLVKKLQTPVNL